MGSIGVCLIICAITIFLFITEKVSLATTAMLSMMMFYLTGCLDTDTFLSCFSNSTCILMVAMYVVAEGFQRTSFVRRISSFIIRAAKGNLTKVMFCYVIAAILLCQFILSTMIPFCILYPMLLATTAEMGISKKKVIYPLALAQITTCQLLPLGTGAIVYSELNSYMAASGVTAVASITDPMLARLPILFITIIYCVFIAPKVIADDNNTVLQNAENLQESNEATTEQLSEIKDICGLIIFAGTTVGLLLSTKLGISDWAIAVMGAILMVLTGVLTPKETVKAIPVSIYLLLVGCLGLAAALTQTGAGSYIGGFIASLIGDIRSSVLFYTIVFLAPFITTQFMLNRAVQLIFYPIIIQTCIALNLNPVGPLLVCQQATFLSFVTPMATPVVPYFMKLGGYDIKELLKLSALPTLILGASLVIWNSIIFPLF